MKRTIGLVIAVCIIGLIVFRVYQAVRSRQAIRSQSQYAQEEVFAVEVIKPLLGDIKSTMSFPGIIKGKNQVQVYPDVPGRLLRYTVKEGQVVKRDELIALVDRSVPGMEYEPAKVRAPVSGIVARLILDVGQTVAPQVPVAIVSDMSQVKVAISVGEKLLSRIGEGMYAIIRLNDMENTELKGRLDRLSSLVDPTTRSAYAEVLVLDDKKDIIPGSFADVEIILEEKKDVILLPRDAVIEDLATGEFFAFVVVSDIAQKRKIMPGIITQENLEVISGVNADEIVITRGKDFLKGGERVKIVNL